MVETVLSKIFQFALSPKPGLLEARLDHGSSFGYYCGLGKPCVKKIKYSRYLTVALKNIAFYGTIHYRWALARPVQPCGRDSMRFLFCKERLYD